MKIKNGVYRVEDCFLHVFDDYVDIETCSSTLFKSPSKRSLVEFFLLVGKCVYLTYTSSSKQPKLDDLYYLENYSYTFSTKFSFNSTDVDLIVKKSCE